MIKQKKELNLKEKIITLIVSLIFISPALIIKDETSIRLAYIILIGAIGWAIGKNLIFYLKEKEIKTERNKIPPLLSNFAIGIYLFAYIVLAFLIDSILLRKSLLLFLIKVFVGGLFFFYGGLKGIQTKRIFLRGFQISGRVAIIYGILSIIFSIFLLLLRYISLTNWESCPPEPP